MRNLLKKRRHLGFHTKATRMQLSIRAQAHVRNAMDSQRLVRCVVSLEVGIGRDGCVRYGVDETQPKDSRNLTAADNGSVSRKHFATEHASAVENLRGVAERLEQRSTLVGKGIEGAVWI